MPSGIYETATVENWPPAIVLMMSIMKYYIHLRNCFPSSHCASYVAGVCRHPLPDQYSITLEIAKDRTTAAALIPCTREMFAGDECPEDVLEGETFLEREINEPCHSMVCIVNHFLLNVIMGVTVLWDHTDLGSLHCEELRTCMQEQVKQHYFGCAAP